MDTQGTSKEDNNQVQPENLSNEKLMAKCRNLLLIAQKAKQAKDDAINKSTFLQEDNKKLSEKVANFEKQLKTSQEMLVALTDQKLNLAMELDDLKKYKVQNLEDIKKLTIKCEKLEIEAESYKRQYDKATFDNENLIQKMEVMEQKLSSDNTRTKQMQADLKKLHENNENVKSLWSNVSKEKQGLEEKLSETNNKLTQLQKDHSVWFTVLSEKYNVNGNNIQTVLESLDNYISKMNECKNSGTEYSSDVNALQEEVNKFKIENEQLKNEIKDLKESFSSLLIDKETTESELVELNRQNEQLNSRLESVNQERDKMVKNLEEVRLETRQLIENSETLSEDLELIKSEKNQIELELSSILEERDSLEQQVKEKQCHFENLIVKLKSNQHEIEELSSELSICKETILKLNNVQKNNDNKVSQDLKEMEQKYQKNYEDLKNLESENYRLNQEIQQYKLHTTQVTEQLETANTFSKEYAREIDDLKSILKDLENKLEQLKAELDKKEIENTSLKQSLESMKLQDKDVEKTKLDFNKKIEVLEKTENLKEEEIRKLHQQKLALENKLKLQNDKLNQYETLLKEKDENNGRVLEQLKNMEKNVEILKNCENVIEELENEKKKLNLHIENLNKSVSKYQESELILKVEIDLLHKNLTILKSEREELSKELSRIDSLEQNNHSLILDLEKEKAVLQDKCNEVDSILTVKCELEAKIDTLLGKIKCLTSELEESKQNIISNKEKETKLIQEFEKQNELISKLKNSNKTMIEEKSSYEKNMEDYEMQLAFLKETEKKNFDGISRLTEEIKTYNGILKDNETIIESLKTEVNGNREQIKEKKYLINSLQKELSDISNLKNNLEESLNTLRTENNNLNEKIEHIMDKNVSDNNMNESVCSALKEELQVTEAEIKNLSTKIEENSRIWNARLTVLKGGLIGLKQTKEDLLKHVQEIQNHFVSNYPQTMDKLQDVVKHFVEDTVATTKRELLGEMQHMNQALKERGEVISKLQETISENKAKLKKSLEEKQELENAIHHLRHSISEKEDQCKNKDIIIKDLEYEITKIKEMHETSTEGDVMSTSTISKADEQSRLKDIEESFEDKYSKLKILAVKLKKRLSEVTHTLETERVKMTSERTEFRERIQNLSSVAKNAQKLQESCDKTLDELEEEKKKNHSLQTSLDSSLKSEESERAKVLALESEVKQIPVLRKQIDVLDSSLKEAKKEIQNLQKEKKVETLKYEDLKQEYAALEKKVGELSQSLEQAKLQGKATNVLELEIQNYEKTIADLSSQLNSERDQIKHLNNEIDAMKNLNSGLEEQIKLLEGRINVEEERNLYMNEQLAANNNKNEELIHQVEQQKTDVLNLQKELQFEKSRCETLTIECSTIGLESKKRENILQCQVDNLQRHVTSLESVLTSTKQDLTSSRNEIEHLRNEFDSYRIRAQSVLAKQKTDIITQGEKEAREQMELLNNEIEVLRRKLDLCMSELDTVKTESSLYLSEKERADKKFEDFTRIIQSKTLENDQLNAEFRSYKISTETLIQCFKSKLEEKDISHKKEVHDQQKKIEELKLRIKEKETSTNGNENFGSGDGILSTISPPNDNEGLPPEREDGEGSESVPSPKMRRRSGLVPLDVLLNSPLDEESRVSVLSDQIDKLRNEVSGYEVRTRHLSSLLSEAEKDSARNAQLNTVLKEEVRRLERSLEREPHAKNTEYLKNVVIKFLTLQSGDERTRLVPVLDTILKLSPEETQKLIGVAKGDTNSSWGHYLPWTSS